ncbi:glycosyltransferase [Candidatus Dojkabacteria bacterium]|jgi:hypothetical protein|nr:glycosyltransferase [Candidatus Dojkabacteria bacterium]
MKVLYFGNFKSEVPTIDQDILYSLKKQAEVVQVDLREFAENEDLTKIILKANKCDVFLFHALIPENNDFYVQLMLERLTTLLEGMTCKKVCWFLDRVMGGKMKIVTSLLPHVDYMYMVDETWTRRFENEKIIPLHPGASERLKNGKKKPELECDIAMLGTLYGDRVKQFEWLKEKFGDKFKLFDDKYGKDFSNVCKSAKVVIVPSYPFDDFFWSDRIYNILASGGVPIHPRAYGLQEAGFVDGTHYIDYYTEQDLFVTLSMILDKKSNAVRKGIAKTGQAFVKSQTLGHRVAEILSKFK